MKSCRLSFIKIPWAILRCVSFPTLKCYFDDFISLKIEKKSYHLHIKNVVFILPLNFIVI